jgi:ubiquinone biosynthesis protein
MVNRLTRYAQIASVLTKYGFGIFLQEVFPEEVRPSFLKRDESIEKLDVYKRIRMAIEELGPTFIKLGQIASVRRDLLPQPLITELLKLTDSVPPVPFEEVEDIIEEMCGPLNKSCHYIEKEPFAAASLSQVYKAILMDGSEVVFKVQRPKIEELIEVDLTILESLAARAESVFPYLKVYNPVGLIREFSIQIRKELDFVRDGKNAETFAANLKEVEGVRIPKIYWEYTQSKVLVMEYIRGNRIDDIDNLKPKHDLKALAELGFQAYLKMIFIDGFFHGDPHPGNLLVTSDGELVFLDFGLVGILRPERRRAFSRIMYSIISSDIELLIDSLDDLGITINPDDLEAFKDEMYSILRETQSYKLGEYSFMDSLNELTTTFYRYHIRLPETFMLMIKVLSMIGDVGSLLDPDFNFIERVKPYLDKIMVAGVVSPESVEEVRDILTRELISFPRSLRKFFNSLSRGDTKVELKLPEMVEIRKSIETAANKIVLGALSAALILGVALIESSANRPFGNWHGTILVLAGLLAFALSFRALRSSTTEKESEQW